MTWIKIETCTADKPEIAVMAASLGIAPEQVLGHCIRFWSWCDAHQKNGVTIVKDTAIIDSYAHLDGFADAMISVGWLTVLDGTIRIPNFDRHLGKSAKNRAANAKRVAAYRKQSKT